MEFHYSKYKTVCSAVQICRFCGSGNDLNTTLGLSLRFESEDLGFYTLIVDQQLLVFKWF